MRLHACTDACVHEENARGVFYTQLTSARRMPACRLLSEIRIHEEHARELRFVGQKLCKHDCCNAPGQYTSMPGQPYQMVPPEVEVHIADYTRFSSILQLWTRQICSDVITTVLLVIYLRRFWHRLTALFLIHPIKLEPCHERSRVSRCHGQGLGKQRESHDHLGPDSSRARGEGRLLLMLHGASRC